jgi:hypothetical protein
MNALVANAKSAPALAVIRSLGKKDIAVTGASDDKNDFPLFSKYCKKKILLKADSDNEKRIDELLEIVRNSHFDVFLPVMSENALLVLAKRKSEFEKHTRRVSRSESDTRHPDSQYRLPQIQRAAYGRTSLLSQALMWCDSRAGCTEKLHRGRHTSI